MSKKIYSIISIIIGIMLMFLLQSEVYAASATISASSAKVEPGKTVTITANIKSSASWELDVSTTGGTLEKNDSRVGNTDSGNNENKSITVGTFSTETEGTYKITLSGYVVDGDTFSKTNINESVSIVVEKAQVVTPPTQTPTTPTTPTTPPATVTKSSEAKLSNFGINPREYDFSGFSKNPNKEEWSAEVPNTVTEVEIYAKAKHDKATVEGAGKVQLKEGNNPFEIKVTAEDGTTTKTYKLTIKRRTVAEEEAANGEARLKRLGIKPEKYDFSGFDSEKTEYSVQIPENINEIEVYATAVDSKAQITGTGIITLEEGESTLEIVVIAANGTKKTYSINVIRIDAEETEEPKQPVEEKFGLSKLTITGVTLNPKFDVETYEYKVDLKEDLTALQIIAEANDEDATVEIVGNENLQEGENVITILVKNDEKEEVVTYQIIVNKVVAKKEIQMSWLKPSTWGKEEIIKIILVVVLIILIISAIILKINISKESKMAKKVDLPGAEELDKAIAEHQELAEEDSNKDENKDEIIEKYEAQANYLEEIAKSRLNEENSDFAVEEFDIKPRRKGKHF